MNREKIIKSIKIALAAVLAISIAARLGFQYSATAGIITVLSIQNTKRETLKSARNRALAFLCALVLAAGAFRLLGFTLTAFAVYLLLFSLLCLYADWGEAIAMDSVLITHFLSEQSMSAALMRNEIALFLIGTSVGILVNMHLRRKEDEFQRLADEADRRIKEMLEKMSVWLLLGDEEKHGPGCLLQLQESLTAAKTCALNNYNNALWKKDSYEVDYIQMRQQQSMVLQELYENVKSSACLPRQALHTAKLIESIGQNYHRDNPAEGLLQELDLLFQDLKGHELPASREEFEARAILFYILKQLKELLLIKRNFALTHAKPKYLMSPK